MEFDKKTIRSMPEENQDFSLEDQSEIVSDEDILAIADRIMDKYDNAFKELAK